MKKDGNWQDIRCTENSTCTVCQKKPSVSAAGQPAGSLPTSEEMWQVDGPVGSMTTLTQTSGVNSTSSGNYTVFKESKNWHDAKQSCVDKGAVMSSVHSSTENEEIKSLFSRESCGSMWLGMQRDKNKSVKEFNDKWVDGSSANYWNWNSGEPNNMSQDCMQMYTSGKWDDVACSSTMQCYVCSAGSDSTAASQTQQQAFSEITYDNIEVVRMTLNYQNAKN